MNLQLKYAVVIKLLSAVSKVIFYYIWHLVICQVTQKSAKSLNIIYMQSDFSYPLYWFRHPVLQLLQSVQTHEKRQAQTGRITGPWLGWDFLIYYFVSVAFYGLHPYMFQEEKISFSISLNFGLKLQKSSLQ